MPGLAFAASSRSFSMIWRTFASIFIVILRFISIGLFGTSTLTVGVQPVARRSDKIKAEPNPNFLKWCILCSFVVFQPCFIIKFLPELLMNYKYMVLLFYKAKNPSIYSCPLVPTALAARKSLFKDKLANLIISLCSIFSILFAIVSILRISLKIAT